MIQVSGKDYEKSYGDRMKYCIDLPSMLDLGMKLSISSYSLLDPADIDATVNRYDR